MTNIEKAKQLYPIGTKFLCNATLQEAVITTALFDDNDCGGVNEYDERHHLLATKGSYHCVYSEERGWAKIISILSPEIY